MYSVVAVVPLLVATALAQQSSSISTPPYENPNTAFTTQTDSNGVITGMPTPPTAVTDQPGVVTSQPGVVTSQPPAAIAPAGLSPGTYTIPYGNATSYVVSVGPSTTVIISNTPTPTSGPGASGGNGGNGGGSAGAPKSTTTSAPGNMVKVGGGSLAGVLAFIAALL